MLQSGYAADFVLGLTVDALNGVRNRSATGAGVKEADPAFVRALELMRDVQAAGGIGMRVDEDKVKGQTAVLFFRRDDVDPGVAEKTAEVRRLLGLPAGQEKFVLTYSPVRGARRRTGGEQPVDAPGYGRLRELYGSAGSAREGWQRRGGAGGLRPSGTRGGGPDPKREGEAR